MKISDVTLQDIKTYMRVEYTDEDNLINAIMESSIAHIKAYTGLSNEQLDSKEDLTIALYILCIELYDNRSGTNKENSKVNEVLDRLIGSHSINLL